MRTRILYIPFFIAAESERFAQTVADWADVESFDVPVEEPVAAAVTRLDELGWDTAVVVADSHAQRLAVEVVTAHPGRIRAVALSHAVARYRVSGDRPALHPELTSAARQLLDGDPMAFWRAVTQLTQGAMADDWVERWAAAVPAERARAFWDELGATEPPLAEALRGLDKPVLLAHHEGCMMWQPEGFEDAVAALPEARAIRCRDIPAFDPAFGQALRELVE
jgi:pimeloyl-ACP methyl ester carboxylesterase